MLLKNLLDCEISVVFVRSFWACLTGFLSFLFTGICTFFLAKQPLIHRENRLINPIFTIFSFFVTCLVAANFRFRASPIEERTRKIAERDPNQSTKNDKKVNRIQKRATEINPMTLSVECEIEGSSDFVVKETIANKIDTRKLQRKHALRAKLWNLFVKSL